MNFFETQAGHNFTMYTVPRMVDAVEKLTAELRKTNEPLENVLTKAHEANIMYDVILKFAEKNLGNPLFLKQFKALWTSYCICKDYEVDTSSYDKKVRELWGILIRNENNPFSGFDEFDNYMCEDLV